MAELTQSQKYARDSQDGTVLVSAAAGSGKTKVLVERVITLITDKAVSDDGTPYIRGKKKCSIDELLIVTFTRAAAAELRQRLSKEISKLIAAFPDDADLRRQKMLIPKARIGTMDSFCSSLVRENFSAAGVAPDFRIINGAERESLRAEVLTEYLDSEYEAGREDFLLAASALSRPRSDEDFFEAIDKIESHAESFPDPEEKLRELCDMYSGGKKPQDTVWGEKALSYTADFLAFAADIHKSNMKILDGDEKLSKAFSEIYNKNGALIVEASEAVREKRWDDIGRMLSMLERPNFQRGPRNSSKTELKESTETVIKFLKNARSFYEITEEDFIKQGERLERIVRELCFLTEQYRKKLDEAMSERRVLGHSDVAHRALRLLCEHRDGKFYRTQLALELSEKFCEVMIDEFQDTSEIQNIIFSAIARSGSDTPSDGTNAFVVGDVKQSIYGFRNAAPSLFLDRFARYEKYDPEKKAYPAKVVLERNFRSRPEVTDFVNYCFTNIMKKELGGIEYDDDQRLYCGGSFPDADDRETEIHIAFNDTQAIYCARLIRKMLDDGYMVTHDGVMRPATPGDFCIMMRSVSGGKADEYAEELAKVGISSKKKNEKALLKMPLVMMILSVLRAADNPLDDVSLTAALHSPVFGFGFDEIAAIARGYKGERLYSKLRAASLAGNEAARQALEKLDSIRRRSEIMPIGRLIAAIYSETGLLSAVQATDSGKDRKNELTAFLQFASSSEKTGCHGLSRFLRMVDRMEETGENKIVIGDAVSEDSVTISTIHVTKGLEYPICILANCEKSFNDEWKKEDLQLGRRLGMGIRLRDAEEGIKLDTLQRETIKLECELENIAEELRILYVAMTRAVDKLIITCSDPKGNIFKAASSLIGDGRINTFALAETRDYASWIIACMLLHPEAEKLRELSRDTKMLDDYLYRGDLGWCENRSIRFDFPKSGEASHIRFFIRALGESAAETADVQDSEEKPAQKITNTESLREKIRERLDYAYPYESECRAPSKVTASAVHPDGGAFLKRPSFMSEGGLTAAEKGTALHRFMQYADFDKASQDAQSELDRLFAAGVLTEREAQAVDLGKVRRFFDGEAGKLVMSAERKEREWRFTAKLDGKLKGYFPECTSDAPVVLQGECDLVLINGDEAVIVDYKTDRVKNGSELVEKYTPQLRLYANAVTQILSVKVSGLYIYSFSLSEFIKLDVNC